MRFCKLSTALLREIIAVRVQFYSEVLRGVRGLTNILKFSFVHMSDGVRPSVRPDPISQLGLRRVL
jgi:hypothetical protein